MKKILFLLAFLLILEDHALAQRSGAGLFQGPNRCGDVTGQINQQTYCFDWSVGTLYQWSSNYEGFGYPGWGQMAGNFNVIIPTAADIGNANRDYTVTPYWVQANAMAELWFANSGVGTNAATYIHLNNDVWHNFWIGMRGSQFNPGFTYPDHQLSPDVADIETDTNAGLQLSSTNAPIWFAVNVTDMAAIGEFGTWGGLNIGHMSTFERYPSPTITSGQLAFGSRDTFGWVVNVTGGQTTLTFGVPFPPNAQTVCTLTDAGQPWVWYAANQSPYSVTFVCVVPWTGQPCADLTGWVEYMCAGMTY